jgi:hypothetical protein
MLKLRSVTHPDGSLYGVRFDCPGCGDPHVIPTTGPKAWGFNGSMDAPTLTPSILVTWRGEDDGKPVFASCHSFVREGKIEFLGDCTHELKGQTVDLPDVTEEP